MTCSKPPIMRKFTFLATRLFTCFLLSGNAYSQITTLPNEFTGPVVAQGVDDLTISDPSQTVVIDLREHFEVANVLGQVVQFDSNVGKINLELFDANTPYNRPVTVANFLDLATNGNYDSSFIHRSVFQLVIQGGGFTITPGTPVVVDNVLDVDPIVNEPGISNTTGTIAMAKLDGDPNSATNQWFFNLVDNSTNLDEQNGGFTVFGRVIGNSISEVISIANFPRWNLDGGGTFASVPLINFDNTQTLTADHFVTFASISPIDIYPTEADPTAVLSFQVTNTKPSLLTASIVGSQLRLNVNPGQSGEAEISVATFDTHDLSAEISFFITVDSDVFSGADIPDFPNWKSSPWYANYNNEFWPWIYHDEHGWQYVFDNGNPAAIFVFDLGLQEWVFLNESSYRWQYVFGDTPGWIFTFPNNTPENRTFMRLDDGSQFTIPPGT